MDLLTYGEFEWGRLYPYERLKSAIVPVGATISRPEIRLCQQVSMAASLFEKVFTINKYIIDLTAKACGYTAPFMDTGLNLCDIFR